jgi:preprotein translocase subunit SecB
MRLEPAKLQLEGYYLREFSCAVRPGIEQGDVKLALVAGLHIQPGGVMSVPPYKVEVDIDSGKNADDPTRYRVYLRIYSDESVVFKERAPYRFDCSLVGYFRVETPATSPTSDLFTIRNAAMILYSTAREIIASVTGRGPVPALVLPTYNFIVDDDIAELAVKATSAKALPTKRQKAKPTKSRPAPAKKR